MTSSRQSKRINNVDAVGKISHHSISLLNSLLLLQENEKSGTFGTFNFL